MTFVIPIFCAITLLLGVAGMAGVIEIEAEDYD